MKIAISALGKTAEDKVDPRFGRTAGFVVYESETDTFSYVDNSENAALPHGAGIQTGQTVAAMEVDAIITGHCGPKASEVIKTAGIKIYGAGDSVIKDAVAACLNGSLKEQG